MFGAIIGDMVGSVYEFHPIKKKDFEIFNIRNRMTDDSYLTLAVAKVLMKHYPIDYSPESLKSIQDDLVKEFIDAWRDHNDAGFGGMFYDWCVYASLTGKTKPYNSYGNGSAMRISPVGWIANSEEEVKLLSKTVTEITHNHPEGIKGAEAVAMAIYLARTGSTKEEIAERMINDYYPAIKDLNFDNLVKTYRFSEICQKSVPQAIYCFLISNSLEDAVRNCVAIGGDCDTTGAMVGAIAEAYFQKDTRCYFEKHFMSFFIEPEYERLIKEFYHMIGNDKFEKPAVLNTNEIDLSFESMNAYHESFDKYLESIGGLEDFINFVKSKGCFTVGDLRQNLKTLLRIYEREKHEKLEDSQIKEIEKVLNSLKKQ